MSRPKTGGHQSRSCERAPDWCPFSCSYYGVKGVNPQMIRLPLHLSGGNHEKFEKPTRSMEEKEHAYKEKTVKREKRQSVKHERL
jgi:hypothetical protein